MARYAVPGTQTAISATEADGILSIERGAAKRFKVYDWTFGTGGTPADNVIALNVRRFGTSSATSAAAVTPEPLDLADGPAVTTAEEEVTAAPGAGNMLFEMGLNQRATYRWVAAPGGELVMPNTALTGVYFAALSSGYAGVAHVTAHIEE